MNKQQFVLNELRAVANDITDLVDTELDQIDQETQRLEKARKEQPEGDLPPVRMRDPSGLKNELAYIMSRLECVKDYLLRV